MKKIIFFLSISIALTSCIKKKLGCSDSLAINYSQDIETNKNYDGTDCMYECSGVFYWDMNTYLNYFVDSLSTYVNLYLDDKWIGADSTSNYYVSGGVNCTDDFVNFTDTIYFESEYKQLKVIDQNQRVMFNEPVKILYGCREYGIVE